jgi:glycosyltransferase involved in cell wall biosynthesis
MKPKVTIGVCVRNCENSILETFETIIQQDFPHELMEIVVIDDGSQDRTYEILCGLVSKSDVEMKIFRRNWKGLGPSRNMVVEKTKGKYIVWVDSDMVLPKYYIRKQVEFMEENPDVGIAGGRWKGIAIDNLISVLENALFETTDYYNVGRLESKLPGTGASIFRVSAIKQVSGFDENITGSGEDMDIAYRIKTAGWTLYRSRIPYYAKICETWKTVWIKHVRHGYGMHYVSHKNAGIIAIWKMMFPASLISGFVCAAMAYRISQRKRTVLLVLLPIYNTLKTVPWLLGFLKSHIDGYGHS